SVAARATVHNIFSPFIAFAFIAVPLFDCCLLRFDAAEARVIAVRLQSDDSGLVAQVTPIPAVLVGERRNERAMRFARALLDLVAVVVVSGPFAFGRLTMKLEVHGPALHAP